MISTDAMMDEKPRTGSSAAQLAEKHPLPKPTPANAAPQKLGHFSKELQNKPDFSTHSKIWKVKPQTLSDLFHTDVIYQPFS